MENLPEPRHSNRLAMVKIPAVYAICVVEIFPAEIEMEILRNILICPEKLAFCQLPRTPKETAENKQKYPNHPQYRRLLFSRVLRLALLNRCRDDEPRAKALMADFSGLCLVSKSMRSMARNVFFAENKWVLHTSGIFDAVTWVAKYWGPDALASMRDVRIELQNIDKICFNALVTFVAAVKTSENLRTLSVRWLGQSRSLQYAFFSGQTWHFHPTSRSYSLERNRERGRGLIANKNTKKSNIGNNESHDVDAENNEDDGGEDNEDDGTDDETSHPKKIYPEPSSWSRDEVVLLPLKDLRGLSDGRIEGTVREAWAIWLESCMTAPKNAHVPDFEFEEMGRKAIEVLKGLTKE